MIRSDIERIAIKNQEPKIEITHESFTTLEHLQNLLGLFDTPLGRKKMNDEQLEVICLARQHVESLID